MFCKGNKIPCSQHSLFECLQMLYVADIAHLTLVKTSMLLT